MNEIGWKSYKEHPNLYQKVLGKSKTMDGKNAYHVGEFSGVAMKSIMIKTWNYEENIMKDGHYRVIQFVTEWKPLDEIIK